MRKRVARLNELARGLIREAGLMQKGHDPLLYLERRAYLVALHKATGGLEDARVALAKACQRIEGGAGGGQKAG